MKNLLIGIILLILFSCSSNPKSSYESSLKEILIEKPQINYKLNSLPRDINVIYISNSKSDSILPGEVKGFLTNYYAFSKNNGYFPKIKLIDLKNKKACSVSLDKEAYNLIFLFDDTSDIDSYDDCLNKFVNRESLLISNFEYSFKKKNIRRFVVNRKEDRFELIKFMDSYSSNIMIIDNLVSKDKYEIGKVWEEKYNKTVAEYKTLNQVESTQDIFSNLLLLGQSTKRKIKLSRIISEDIEHNARTRLDIDSLFLSVSTEEARSIKPTLDYNYFEGMAVFLINDWDGDIQFLETDKDLEDVISIDFPFMIPTSLPEDLKTVQNKSRNFAIGYDAFEIVLLIKGARNLNKTIYKGLTGKITFKDKSIYRKSTIFEIKNGKYIFLN